MEAHAPPSLKPIAFGDINQELSATRRLLERVPDDHLDWKPHERSMSLGALAAHLANLLRWQTSILEQDAFDLADGRPEMPEPSSGKELLQMFDENAAALKAAMAEADNTALGRTWTLRRGDEVLMAQSKAAVLRRMGLSHMIHHRGQLSVYLRLLDVPLPPLYGATADEEPRR